MTIKRPKTVAAMREALPLTGQRLAWVDFEPGASSDDADGYGGVVMDAPIDEANIMTSLVSAPGLEGDGVHRVALDVDLPVMVLPSTTKGHHHLFIDSLLPWEDYLKLLDVLAEIGLVEQGYVSASRERGYTAVRLPWVASSRARREALMFE